MLNARALSNPTSEIMNKISAMKFADGEFRDVLLVKHDITTGIITENPQIITRFDLVEESSGLTFKTYTSPTVAYFDTGLFTRCSPEKLQSGATIYKVMAFGCTVHWEVELDSKVIGTFKSLGEARNYNGERPPAEKKPKKKRGCEARK